MNNSFYSHPQHYQPQTMAQLQWGDGSNNDILYYTRENCKKF